MPEYSMLKNYEKILSLIQDSKDLIKTPGESEILARKISDLFPLTFVETKTNTTWFTFDTKPKIGELVDIRYKDGTIAWNRKINEENLLHYINKSEGWKLSFIPKKTKWFM